MSPSRGTFPNRQQKRRVELENEDVVDAVLEPDEPGSNNVGLEALPT